MTDIRVALIGDHDPEVTAHRAIPIALELAAKELDLKMEYDWIHTTELDPGYEDILKDHSGIWCVPASPYKSMQGALNSIKYARENDIPFLGTCGGFQHAMIEYARNVLNISEADHQESNASSKMPLISAMACALREKPGKIKLVKDSLIRSIYGDEEIEEEYNCGFGFNSHYNNLFENSGLKFTGFDDSVELRSAEIPTHKFFMITAFQPERSAFKNKTHPLIKAFCKTQQ